MIFHDPLLEKTETEVHQILRDEEEEEETLSFCEYSINSDSDLWGNSSRESSQNSSFKSSEEEEDCFEFFSHEWSIGEKNSLSSNPPPQNIIFCGKLISYKQPTSENTDQKVDHSIKLRKHKKIRPRGIFRWKWNYFSSSRKTKRQKKGSKSVGQEYQREEYSSQIVPGSYKSLTTEPDSARKKQSKEQGSSVHKMSLFTSSPGMSSSRWYLFFFGINKYRTKMELRDMKIRQSRSRKSSSFHNNDESTVCMNKSNKGFWAVLRALSCGTSDHSTDVILRPSTVVAGSNIIPLV